MEITLQRASAAVPRIFLACPGVGHVHRGFESFTEECWRALSERNDLEAFIIKGAGHSNARSKRAWCLRRSSRLASLLGRLCKRDAYFIEQVSFAISIVPFLLTYKPDLVFFSDGTVGNVLHRIRKLLPRKPALLFSNGGPLFPPYCKCDAIQQIVPQMLDRDAPHQRLLPYGFEISEELRPLSVSDRNNLRLKLRLPIDRFILVSVAALSMRHKRLDYLIREVAKCPSPRPYLLMLGERTDETPELELLAQKLLDENSFCFLTVSHPTISEYYRAADAFCHTALTEGFGRCIVEAMAQGLPVLLHDTPNNHFIASDLGIYGNFSAPDGLYSLLPPLLDSTAAQSSVATARHRYVFEKFSWRALTFEYIKMFQEVLSDYRKSGMSSANDVIS